ncbi:TPA: hypothetical protein ACGZ99_001430 [Elizabethkingia anophelis]
MDLNSGKTLEKGMVAHGSGSLSGTIKRLYILLII